MIKREKEIEGGTEHRITLDIPLIAIEVLRDADKEIESWEEEDTLKLEKVLHGGRRVTTAAYTISTNLLKLRKEKRRKKI